MIALGRLLILAISGLVMYFTDYEDKKDTMRKWRVVGAIALQIAYLGLGLFNKSPFVIAQLCIIIGMWMFWLSGYKEKTIYTVIVGIAGVGLLFSGIVGIMNYEANMKIVNKEISSETRELSVTDNFIYPEGDYYTFFTRNEDGSIETVNVKKENVKIYDNLPSNAESYVEVKIVLEQRWNHNRHTPNMEWEGEKIVYEIHLPQDSIALV